MQIKPLVRSLLDWYDKNKRDLPFRSTNDPYKIWLSEIMLQQTQVSTVIPFYLNWIKRFPTVESVANADYDKVLKFWEGLGYYRRCFNFHKASKIILESHNGQIPSDYQSFINLPGVGDYTAGAVLSIAFNKKIPAIDGNVIRVISRLKKIKNLTVYNKKIINKTVESLVPDSDPGIFNQSLMEIGALICLPKNPQCHKCPIKLFCKAFKTRNPNIYPISTKQKTKPHFDVVVGIIWRNGKIFIQKRSNDKMLGGLWEFPGGKVKKGELRKDALKRELKEECKIIPFLLKKVGFINHSYSHFSITLHCYHCFEQGSKVKTFLQSKWISPNEIESFSFPKANHKIFKLLDTYGWDI